MVVDRCYRGARQGRSAAAPDDSRRVEVQVRGTLLPVAAQGLGVNVHILPATGREGGGLGGPRPARAVPSEFSLDLDAPTAEGAQDFRRNAVKLGKTITDGPPTDSELGGQPLAKHGLIEAPGRHRVRIDGPRVERGPTAIRPERHVRHDGVRVQLRISRP